MAALAYGCGGTGNDHGNGNGNGNGFGGGNIVTNNPQTIEMWTQLNGKSDIAATMRVNDSGMTVTSLPITILSASVASINLSGVDETGVDDLYCLPNNGRAVYEGDSGSPVLVSGNVAGGLFGSADNQHFDARGIEQMESTASGPPVRVPESSRRQAEWHIHGPQGIMPIIRSKPGFGNAIYEGPVKHIAKPGVSEAVPLIPGLRYACPFVLGPFVVGYDMAALTLETSNGNWVATGHGLEDAGTVNWPVMYVSVEGPNSDGTIHADPVGNIYGTMLYDGQRGSLINPNTPAPTMPVTVNLTLNGSQQPESDNIVKFDLGSSTENMGIEGSAESTLEALLQGQGGAFGGSGMIQITTMSGTTSHNLTFVSGQSIDSISASAGTQIDTVLTNQHSAAPASQIQSITISLNITSG